MEKSERIFDLKSLVKDHSKQFNHTMQWNGFSDTQEGKSKWEKYKNSWQEWDKNNIIKLNLKEYLGEQSLNDLILCLDNDEHNTGITFQALVNETDDGNFVLCEREETLEIIRKWKYNIEFKRDAYYCCFRFKTKIKESFYGGSFLGHKEGMNMQEGIELLDEVLDSKERFMPTLSKQIEDFIGENNFLTDYYEFGSEDFGLYWFIRKEIFDSFIDKFLGWIKYEELQDNFIYYSVMEGVDNEYKCIGFDINKNEIKN